MAVTESKSTLAILGGEKLVKNPPQEKWQRVNGATKKAVMALLDEGTISISDDSDIIGEFQTAFREMVGTRYAMATNSGTAALHSAYFAVGVGPGDEVIVPSYTWHASVTPILHCAATPVFAEIDPNCLTLDPDDIERKITPKTKAICVTHMWGNVADMDRIVEIAKKHNLRLIEDASHAHGASWKGKKVGSFGDVGCFSMQAAKAVTGGEGGVATTDDPKILDRMLFLGHFNRPRTGEDKNVAQVGDISLGAKYRSHPWAIAMAKVQLERLPELNAKRTKNYQLMNDRLRDCDGIEVIDPLPGAERGGYLEFKFKLSKDIVKIASCQRIAEAMAAEGTRVQYCRYCDYKWPGGMLHTAPLFNSFDLRSIGGCFYDPTISAEDAAKREVPSLPVTEDLANRLIGTPAFVDVTTESLEEACAAMIKVIENVEALGS